uniref:EF-hand domain-containing protein n=1 Tax=Parastrongyloides trichosuri TaxID=131310 RepID=A0A0N5A7D7_PARTI
MDYTPTNILEFEGLISRNMKKEGDKDEHLAVLFDYMDMDQKEKMTSSERKKLQKQLKKQKSLESKK